MRPRRAGHRSAEEASARALAAMAEAARRSRQAEMDAEPRRAVVEGKSAPPPMPAVAAAPVPPPDDGVGGFPSPGSPAERADPHRYHRPGRGHHRPGELGVDQGSRNAELAVDLGVPFLEALRPREPAPRPPIRPPPPRQPFPAGQLPRRGTRLDHHHDRHLDQYLDHRAIERSTGALRGRPVKRIARPDRGDHRRQLCEPVRPDQRPVRHAGGHHCLSPADELPRRRPISGGNGRIGSGDGHHRRRDLESGDLHLWVGSSELGPLGDERAGDRGHSIPLRRQRTVWLGGPRTIGVSD